MISWRGFSYRAGMVGEQIDELNFYEHLRTAVVVRAATPVETFIVSRNAWTAIR
jgi:hypothetical protein